MAIKECSLLIGVFPHGGGLGSTAGELATLLAATTRGKSKQVSIHCGAAGRCGHEQPIRGKDLTRAARPQVRPATRHERESLVKV